MKKIILFATFVVVAFATQAQTEKSTWLLGGAAGFGSTGKDDYKTTSFSITPKAGYFAMDNLAIGAGLGFSSFKVGDDDATTSLSFGPFVRYYFVNLGENAKLFGNANVDFGSQKESGTSIGTTQWGIAAGPAIFLNKNTALEMTLGYSSFKLNGDDEGINSFGVAIGFQIHLGGK